MSDYYLSCSDHNVCLNSFSDDGSANIVNTLRFLEKHKDCNSIIIFNDSCEAQDNTPTESFKENDWFPYSDEWKIYGIELPNDSLSKLIDDIFYILDDVDDNIHLLVERFSSPQTPFNREQLQSAIISTFKILHYLKRRTKNLKCYLNVY